MTLAACMMGCQEHAILHSFNSNIPGYHKNQVQYSLDQDNIDCSSFKTRRHFFFDNKLNKLMVQPGLLDYY